MRHLTAVRISSLPPKEMISHKLLKRNGAKILHPFPNFTTRGARGRGEGRGKAEERQRKGRGNDRHGRRKRKKKKKEKKEKPRTTSKPRLPLLEPKERVANCRALSYSK
jgi:hypothetical protein